MLFVKSIEQVACCELIFSKFYEVIVLGGTYVIGEGKMQSVYLNIELHL
jgi:hypothetical protein